MSDSVNYCLLDGEQNNSPNYRKRNSAHSTHPLIGCVISAGLRYLIPNPIR